MSVITLDNRELLINSSNFIYSKTNSRPSKSIVDPEKYIKYNNIKQSFTILEDSDDILLLECLNYVFYTITKISENIYMIDNETYKIINFTHNKFNKLTEQLKDKYHNYIIILKDIYTYPKIQYIYMMSNFFTEIKIIMSQIKSYSIIVCRKKIKNFEIELKGNYIRDFDIKVDEMLIKYVKTDNDIFLDNIININNNISEMCKSLSEISNLNREIYTLNKYYKSFINKKCNTYCDCKINNIFYSNIFQCYICEKCLVLSQFFLF